MQLRADDVDWRFGAGEPVEAPAADMLLVLAGRRLPAGRLRGPAAASFTTH